MGIALALSALLLTTPAVAADEPDGLSWEFSKEQRRRYLVETDVVLPGHLWFYGDFNTQARARTVQLRMITDCRSGDSKKKVHDVTCTVTDAAISGATFYSERGLLQPVLEEIDTKLTGARFTARITNLGQVKHLRVDLQKAHPQTNRRIRQMDEVIRLLMYRGLAGFDQRLPRDATELEQGWVHHSTVLYDTPSLVGTAHMGDIFNSALEMEDGKWLIRSAGQGLIVPGSIDGNPRNFFESTSDTMAVFDAETGTLLERQWRAHAEPTASSLIAQGLRGMPYAQRGALRLLHPDEEVELGESVEWSPRILSDFRYDMLPDQPLLLALGNPEPSPALVTMDLGQRPLTPDLDAGFDVSSSDWGTGASLFGP